jgi:hypothetical protein
MNSFHAIVLKDSETGDGPLNRYFTSSTKETVCLFLFIYFLIVKQNLIIKILLFIVYSKKF